MQISMAFQGGGARVVELMAAVEAVRKLSKGDEDFEVFRVVGASAGAVAAAMYATGCDIGAIIAQADKLKAIIDQRFRLPSTLGVLTRLMRGRSIYDEKELHGAIVALFKLGGIDALRPIRELVVPPLQVRIATSDIRDDSSVVATEESHAPLADVLVDSCAIPFAFRVPRGTARAHILDGGLFQNLPAREALKGLSVEQTALGISFAGGELPDMEGMSLRRYAAEIIGSLLGERVKDAEIILKPSNVIKLQSRRSTLAFADIVHAELYAEFQASINYAYGALEGWKKTRSRVRGANWSSRDPSDIAEQQKESDREIMGFFERKGSFRFHANLVHQEVVFQSGASGDLPDIYKLHLQLSGSKNRGLQFMQFRSYDLDQAPTKRVEIEVLDRAGRPLNSMTLPIREIGDTPGRPVLLCLGRPLRDDDEITIIKTEETYSGMGEYLGRGTNFEKLSIGEEKSADELRITVHFPVELQPLHVRDVSGDFENERKVFGPQEGLQLLTTTTRSTTLRIGSVSWVSTARGAVKCDQTQYINVIYDSGRR